MKLTAIIEKAEDGWFVGQIEEVPAAISQGKTIEEVKSSLVDAIKLLWNTNKGIVAAENLEKQILREEIEVF